MKLQSTIFALVLTLFAAHAMALDVSCQVTDASSTTDIAPVTFTVNADDPRLVPVPIENQNFKIMTGRKLVYSTATAKYYAVLQFSNDPTGVFFSNVAITKNDAKDAVLFSSRTAMASELLIFEEGQGMSIFCAFSNNH